MAKAWHDPRVPADVDCVLRPLLERRAAETPDKVFALFADGSAWTYREAREAARRAAVGFRRLGVAQGDTVLSWLPNGPDALRVWFGLNYLGAVYVPINLAYRGGILEHVVDNSDARLIVAPCRAPGRRLEPIRRSRLADAVVVGGTVGAIDGLTLHDDGGARCRRGRRPAAARARDRALGHPVDHLHLGHDRAVEGRAVVVPAALLDGRRVVLLHRRRRPLPGEPADVPRRRHRGGLRDAGERRLDRPGRRLRHGAVLATVRETRHDHRDPARRDGELPGEAAARPRRTATTRCARAIMVPLVRGRAAFSRRFGFDIYTVFNMTEVSTPLRLGPEPVAARHLRPAAPRHRGADRRRARLRGGAGRGRRADRAHATARGP